MCHTTNTSNCDSNDELTENTVPNTESDTESQAGQFIRKSLLVSDLFGKTFEPPVGPSEACPVVLAQDAEETTTRSRFRTLLDWPHWTSAMWVSLLLCLGTCIGVAWYDSPSNSAVLPAGEIGTVGGASLRRPEVKGWAGYAPSLLGISRVRVGMRVAAENPEVSDAERRTFVDPDPTTWRFLKLRLPKNQSTDSGSASSLVLTSTLATDFVAIDLLRPLEWLEKQGAKVGGRVYLDLEELGAKGWAEVLEIGPCPEIVPGPGSVVTATFAHQPTSEILDVTISVGHQSPGGLTLDQPSSQDTSSPASETIGVTANHPFWSVDHQAFVPVGLLKPGTRVKTHLDQIQTIVALHPRPGPPEKVYNLEVHSEHVYYVSADGILVHNSGCGHASIWLSKDGKHVTIVVHSKSGTYATHMTKVQFEKGYKGSIEVATAFGGKKQLVAYVELKNADAAIAFQKTLVGSSGTWEKGVNSCVTHVIDVLRAGGAKGIDNLPKTIDEGFFKSLLNLLDN